MCLRNSFICVICYIAFFCAPVHSQEPKKVQEGTKLKIDDFAYTSKDKRDPFEPVYFLKVKKSKTLRSKKTEVVRHSYELEELKLVGIIKKEKNRYAMMEDLQGIGILLKKGDLINPRMWIMDITDNKVVLGYNVKGNVKRFELEIPR